MDQTIYENNQELLSLCVSVRKLTEEKKHEQCREMIAKAIGRYPHAPEPHNLLGVLLEKEGDHIAAMKHFRAAWALDPTYIPVRHNLDLFASFYAKSKCAFDISDCTLIPENMSNPEYSANNEGGVSE